MNPDNKLAVGSKLDRAFAILFASVACILFLSGCGGGGDTEADDASARRYELRGKVISVDKAKREVVVEHEAVTDLMEAMTMPFVLKDKDALEVVGAGDRIQATLVVANRGSWLENPIITKGDAAGSAQTGASSEPQAGAEVPDFSLVNQDNRPVRLSSYRGRALLLTFIYTRCPLPDYCTLMSTNFAQLDRELQKEPELYRKTHLLSVTLDPAYDTPKVLRSYGAAHTERYSEERFDHWEFATGKPEEIKRLAEFFGLSYYEEKDQIIHALRTAIISPEGRVYKIYRGNEWKPEELLGDLRSLLKEGRASE